MLKKKLTKLAEMDGAQIALEEEMQAAREKLEQTELWLNYESIRLALGEFLQDKETLRNEIKEFALDEYRQTQEKKPVDGVAIRIYRCVAYDPEIALDWCKEYLPMALKLQKSKLEKHLKAIQDTAPPEWVEYYEEPRTTISSDLSVYLKGENGNS